MRDADGPGTGMDDAASRAGDRAGETDPGRQRQATRLAAIQRRLLVVDLVLLVGALVVFQVSGASEWLRDRVDLSWPLEAPAAIGIAFGAFGVARFPLDVYGGFVVPRRFGLLTQSFGAWLWDRAKGLAITAPIGLVLVEVLYGLLHAAGGWWWLWTALAYFAVGVALAVVAPVLLFPFLYKVRPLEDRDLLSRIERLAQAAGARIKGAYVWLQSEKGTTANAALMGLGSTRRVVVSDTLLEKYSPEEIEVVLAHELGHQVHRDIPKALALQLALTLASFAIAGWVLDRGVDRLGLDGRADVAAFPLLALTLGLFGFLIGPAQKAYSRYAERKADEYALEATGMPREFMSMMTKLTDQNLGEADPPAWVRILFYDHPTHRQRVAAARRYLARGTPGAPVSA